MEVKLDSAEEARRAKFMEEAAINRFCHNNSQSNRLTRGIADVPRVPAYLIFIAGIMGVLILMLVSTQAQAAEHYVCRNPIVIDGDTLICSGRRVRLEGIDARECRSPCRDSSSQWLRENTRGTVTCSVKYHDRYGRGVGVCRSMTTGDLGRSSATRGYSRKSVYNGPKYR